MEMPPRYLPSHFSSIQKFSVSSVPSSPSQRLLPRAPVPLPLRTQAAAFSCLPAARGVPVYHRTSCRGGEKKNHQHHGPGCGQGPRLKMSVEGRSYFGGEECVFNCLDEGVSCFMDVWGLGTCLFFLRVRYRSGGKKKNWTIYICEFKFFWPEA